MSYKVLFIMHMPPPIHGASMVGKYIHDSVVLNSEFECHYLNPTTAKNLEDVNRFRFGKVFGLIGLIKRIKEKVHEIQPDLVYFTANAAGMPFYKDWFIVRALKGMGCKIVVHFHNKGVATRQEHFVDNILYKKFFKGLKVIQLADTLYSDVNKYVKRDDVMICGNGVPDTQEQILRSVPDGNTNNPLNILYLSNMMQEKGVFQLLEACAKIKQKGKSFVCRFAGGWKDISENDFIQIATKLGLTVSTPSCMVKDADVVALGPQYGDDKLRCFKKANLFVFPTYYHNECFPLVLLEAMQCQLPCISTYEAAIPDIIEDGKTGFVIEKAGDGKPSIEALSDAIDRMIADRMLCYKMGLESRKKYEQKYTLSAFETKFVQSINWAIHKK